MDFDVQLPYTRGVNAIPRLSFLFTTQQPLHLDENLLANVFLPPPFINYITRVIISVNKAVVNFVIVESVKLLFYHVIFISRRVEKFSPQLRFTGALNCSALCYFSPGSLTSALLRRQHIYTIAKSEIQCQPIELQRKHVYTLREAFFMLA